MSAICNESVVASDLKLCHPLGQNRVIEWLDQDQVEAEWVYRTSFSTIATTLFAGAAARTTRATAYPWLA